MEAVSTDAPFTEPLLLKVAGQQEILSQIVEYLSLAEIGKLFSVVLKRQPKRDVFVRSSPTFRPTESLLKAIVKRGLIRQEDETINFSEKIYETLFIPHIASGVDWEKMHNLYQFIQWIPLDKESETFGNLLTFKKFGMKIAVPCRRCCAKQNGKKCDKLVLRRNKCLFRSHQYFVAHHCRFHENKFGCGRCLEEGLSEDEDYDPEAHCGCPDCGQNDPDYIGNCCICGENFCMDWGCGGNYCTTCEDMHCNDCLSGCLKR